MLSIGKKFSVQHERVKASTSITTEVCSRSKAVGSFWTNSAIRGGEWLQGHGRKMKGKGPITSVT